jgi:hypothetical protein
MIVKELYRIEFGPRMPTDSHVLLLYSTEPLDANAVKSQSFLQRPGTECLRECKRCLELYSKGDFIIETYSQWDKRTCKAIPKNK